MTSTKETKVVTSKYGQVSISFDKKYHMYSANLVKHPSIEVQSRFADVVVTKIETLCDSLVSETN
jgi:hypothetical protein